MQIIQEYIRLESRGSPGLTSSKNGSVEYASTESITYLLHQSYCGMIDANMANVRKIAISLPSDLAAAIAAAAQREHTSVSGWIAEAAARRLRRRSAIQALKEYEAEFGEISENELEAVELWLTNSSE